MKNKDKIIKNINNKSNLKTLKSQKKILGGTRDQISLSFFSR